MRWIPLVALAACVPDVHVGDGDTDPDPDVVDSDPADTADTARIVDTDEAVPRGCRGDPAPAARRRAVVVAFPYAADGGGALAWEVMVLGEDGGLTRPGVRFTMGRAPFGNVAFSPDGSLGVAPQDDGSLGVFTLDGDLRPTVVETDWDGDGAFYAGQVVFDVDGSRAWIVDGNWVENGGGIHEVAFDCTTGAPTYVGKVIPTKLAEGLHLLGDGRAVVVAAEVDGAGPADAFLLDGWPDLPQVVGHVTLFDYEDPFVGGHAVTDDGRWLLVGDNSEFASAANRVAFAGIDGDDLVAAGDLEIQDPFSIVASPFDTAALVASGYGDSLSVLSRDDGEDVPFADAGRPTWNGPHPALPGPMAAVRRGPLRGTVLVSENTAIRRVRFDRHGGVEDLGPTSTGPGLEDIPGAIGVQP